MNKEILLKSIKVERDIVKNILLVLSGLLFLTLFSQLKIVLPFTPVPLTGQTFAVGIIGLIYGKKIAPAVIISYILAGSIGIPVYAGFKIGVPLMFASGGYIIGFIFSTYILGYLVEKNYTNSFLKIFLSLVIGYAVIYFFGLLQLSFFVSGKNVFELGLYPFILGDFIKIFISTLFIEMYLKVKK